MSDGPKTLTAAHTAPHLLCACGKYLPAGDKADSQIFVQGGPYFIGKKRYCVDCLPKDGEDRAIALLGRHA